MQQLADGFLLYHGGYTEITKIDLSMCKGGLDFGKGINDGRIAVFRFHPDPELLVVFFPKD